MCSNNNLILKKKLAGVEFSVSAPGKVILHGEHSVVYGKLAIAASLGLRTKIHLLEIDTPHTLLIKILPINFEHVFNLNDIQKDLLDITLSVTSSHSEFNWECFHLINHGNHLALINDTVDLYLKDKNNPVNDAASKAVKALFYLFSGIFGSTQIILSSMCITVDSELSMGAGTGSSAALSVAYAALFIRYLKLKTLNMENISKSQYKRFIWDKRDMENQTHFTARELEAISDWAFCTEKLFHGKPSGIDNTVCTYGNLVKFRRNHSTDLTNLSTPFTLLLINTKVARETLQLVERVAQLKDKFPHVTEHILDAMEDLTVNALTVIKKIDTAAASGDDQTVQYSFAEWETLLQINHNLLSGLGISHPKLEQVIMILNDHGLKGKLTGAGGGGYAISVLPPLYDPEEVIRKLKEQDFEVILTKLGGEGVKVDDLLFLV